MLGMRLLVAGGSQGVGRWAAARARQLGRDVRIMARRPERAGIEGADLFRGDALDKVACEAAVSGCEQIICALGLLYSDGKLLESTERIVDGEGVINLIEAAERQSARRFVLVSSLGAGASWNWLPWFVKRQFEKMGGRVLLREKGRAEQVLQRSALDWTILRPGYLHEGRTRLAPFCVEGPGPGVTSRQAAADVSVRALSSPAASGRVLTVIDGELATLSLFRFVRRPVRFEDSFVPWRLPA